ncbi:hypothetical protein B0T13DRAFT_505942 [Neurospora crassa]|nr:hypothetical protein B0T13DRAFT_505942 [Neurospora crassa]
MTLTIRRAVFGVFCSMAAQETILQSYSTHWPDNDMNAFPPEGCPPAGTQPFNHQGLMLQHRIANITNTLRTFRSCTHVLAHDVGYNSTIPPLTYIIAFLKLFSTAKVDVLRHQIRQSVIGLTWASISPCSGCEIPRRPSFHAVYSLSLLPLLHKASRGPARWTRSLSPPIVGSSIFTAAGIVDAINAISPSPIIALVATLIVKFLVWGDRALLAELNVAPDVIPPSTPWLLTLPTFMFLVLRGHATEGPTNPAASHDGLEQVMDRNVRYACQQLQPKTAPRSMAQRRPQAATTLATSKHMHHAHKLGVLYVVGSVTRKWLDQAKAPEQPTALGAQDSPAAPIFPLRNRPRVKRTIGVLKSFVKIVNKATAQRDNKDQTTNGISSCRDQFGRSGLELANTTATGKLHEVLGGRTKEDQRHYLGRYARDELKQAGKDQTLRAAKQPCRSISDCQRGWGMLDRQGADIRLEIEMKRVKTELLAG